MHSVSLWLNWSSLPGGCILLPASLAISPTTDYYPLGLTYDAPEPPAAVERRSQMQSMQVTVDHPTVNSKQKSVAVLTLAGELGFSAMLGGNPQHSGIHGDTALYETLKKSLPAIPKLVVVDVHGVTYLSSLGMGALLRFQADIKSAGGEMRLAAPTDLLKSLLERMRLDQAFAIFPDVAAASK